MAAARNNRVVIKLGTGVLTRGVGELDTERMRSICEQIALALKNGWQPILVSSGAVGLGMGRLGLKLRPKKISSVQKCAAVGQGILIQTWAELFQPFKVCVAQILLTRDDLDVRSRYRAMRDLLDELLGDRIVPIINENDCISAAELNIKFGDNDVLSSLVASLSKASKLLILSRAGARGYGRNRRNYKRHTKNRRQRALESRRNIERNGGRRNGYKNQGGGNRGELRLRSLYRKRRAGKCHYRNPLGREPRHALCGYPFGNKLEEKMAGAFRQDYRENPRGQRRRRRHQK